MTYRHDRTYMKEKTKEFFYYGNPASITVLYGTRKLGTQEAYISVTADIFEGKETVCCGQLHSHVLDHFPELAPLVAMHMASVSGVPMHYLPNAKHWLTSLQHKHCLTLPPSEAEAYEERMGPWGFSSWRTHDPDPVRALKRTICLGVMGLDDALVAAVDSGKIVDMTWSELEAILKDRLPHLKMFTEMILDELVAGE